MEVDTFRGLSASNSFKLLKELEMVHWRFIPRDCCLPEKEFIKAVQFVLDSFFDFDSITSIYKQNYGTPMGSPLFPVIVDDVTKLRYLAQFKLPQEINELTV
ncbi:hypothetical protein ALC60_10934 [Trachymyrmex zeteki]|uniref:Uncharacterized protein n=1 Tax=Mycetomoellerius zeteki TaxID=64791 RepID=A0A151WQ02_9HYME|nr:hypothetical protein ALC60_10934 [Trachymyrmex zeteki]